MNYDITGKKVVVLLSTYNGELFLSEQLESLERQDLRNMSVFVRDDSSSDNTIEILKQWKEKKGDWLSWYQGDNVGPAKSFMELLNRAPMAQYYAFCDQDDYWESDKISSAIKQLDLCRNDLCIYCSNVEFVNSNLEHLNYSRFNENKSMMKALIYNQAVGCTMVISRKLIDLCISKSPEYLLMHDAWIYRVCVSVEGEVVFDHDSHIRYRQHGNNVAGGSANIIKKWINRFKLMQGKRKNKRKLMAVELLKCYCDFIPDANKISVKKLACYDENIKSKLRLIKDRNIYSNSLIGNIGLVFAILFKQL